MINDKNQKQEGGEKSTNLQAQNITLNQGISYSDAKEIANDVFQNNFLKLSQTALEKAEERANELVDEFIEKMKDEKPEAIGAMETPSMQHALYTAQKEYAKTGDKELSDVLVDLLIERIDKQERSLIQIVLDESIEVASKLTNPQFDILTLVFVLKYSMNHSLGNIQKFEEYINQYIVPFTENLTQENSCYQHLEYSKCCLNIIGTNIEKIFKDNYKGLFQKGHTQEEIEKKFEDYTSYSSLFVPCLRDGSLLQVKALNDNALIEALEKSGLPASEHNKLKGLFNSKMLSDNEIKSYIESIHPNMVELVTFWNETMSSLNLTSVGIALGRANLKRKANISLDLSIWIK